MEKIRKPVYRILYKDKDITKDVSYFVSSVKYIDNNIGMADEISIDLENRDGRWFDRWMPQLSDRIKLYIGYEGEDLLYCGSFQIDELRYKGFPETFSMKGNSFPYEVGMYNTKKSRVFENTTLEAIVRQIVNENNLQPFIRLKDDINIKRIEQHNITDSKFLDELAKKFGCFVIFSDEKVVFSSWQYLAEIPASLTINRDELISYSINDNNHTLYKEAVVEYFDKEDNKLKTYAYKDKNIKFGDVLKIQTKAEDLQQAKEIAKTALKSNNMLSCKIQVTLIGNPKLVSGLNVNLEGFGNYNGKYSISTSTHEINFNGYTTTLELMPCWTD